MSKTFKTAAILLVFCATAMAQKPTVAIGITGEEPPDFKALQTLASHLAKDFVHGDKYTAVNRSEDILAVLGKEHMYQISSGLVDSNSIVDLGKHLGADYVCVIYSTKVMDSYKLEARLINLKTAGTTGMGITYSGLDNLPNLIAASESLTCELRYGAGCKQQKEKQAKLDAYQNFTQLERFGTFALNHVFGLGSLLIMENNSDAGFIALFEAFGILFYVLGSSVIEVPVDWGEMSRAGLKYSFIGVGLAFLGGIEIYNAYSSFGYNKPKPISDLTDPRNFHLAVLPNRNGDGMAYGLMYNVRF